MTMGSLWSKSLINDGRLSNDKIANALLTIDFLLSPH
jgi:hypothetical protein